MYLLHEAQRDLPVAASMSPLTGDSFDGDVEAGSNLERMIALSDGDTNRTYRVLENGAAVGQLDMKDLVKALVPRVRGDVAGRAR